MHQRADMPLLASPVATENNEISAALPEYLLPLSDARIEARAGFSSQARQLRLSIFARPDRREVRHLVCSPSLLAIPLDELLLHAADGAQ